MANVQLENGYTKIAHEILEEIAKVKLSPTQYRLLCVIWTYTYGFNRKEHDMSLSFLSNATGCDSRQIQRELKKLQRRRIISQNIKHGSYRKITFNKDYEEWVVNSTNGKSTNTSVGNNIKSSIGESTNQDININKSKYKNDPFEEYQKYFGIPSPITIANFTYWIENSQFVEPEEIICEAIKRAKLQTPRNPTSYIESILKKLHNLELYTLDAIKKYNEKFDLTFRNKNKKSVPDIDEMFSKEIKSTNLSEKELREARELEEEFLF